MQMGPGQALMRLASDAVRAAAESPFLAAAVGRPSAILCSISLPSPKQRFAGDEQAVSYPIALYTREHLVDQACCLLHEALPAACCREASGAAC